MFEFNEKDIKNALSGYFYSEEPLKLRQFPSKQKRKYVVLKIILKKFSFSKKYSEKEVNDILSGIYNDFVTLRRALIDFGLMSRKNDGSEYWVNKE